MGGLLGRFGDARGRRPAGDGDRIRRRRIPLRDHGPGKRLLTGDGGRSVAGQVFVMQILVVVLLVVASLVALVTQARHDSKEEAVNRSLAVAETFASSPDIERSLASSDPTAVLQPRAEAARKRSGVDFVVVMTREGIRYTHPKPDRIGKRYVGTLGPAQRGGTVTETYPGTLGPAVQAVVPVRADGGRIVGLVSAGITIDKVSGEVNAQLPILLGTTGAALGLATWGTLLVNRRLRRQTHDLGPAEMTRMYEHHDAVLHSVHEGVLIVGGDGRLLLANDEARRLLELPPDAEGRPVGDLGLEPSMAELLASGRVATDEVHSAEDRLLSVNHRPTDLYGGPPGSVATLRDTTELAALTGKARMARERLQLLYEGSMRIGSTLDIVRTAEELAEVAVPRFADHVTVDLADSILRGDEPRDSEPELRRSAVRGMREGAPFFPLGRRIRFVPSTPQSAGLRSGRGVLEADLTSSAGWQEQAPERARSILGFGAHSLITVPLQARGVVLGVANFWRSERTEPFEADDLSLAEDLSARASVYIDNARRYTREHTMAVTLQRSLLPSALPELAVIDAAFRYMPAQAGVGGDWFDVIPLSSSRVALVVGDVVGHGLHAAATMGRLRTAVHNFSTLDLPPDEILGHLDALVNRIDQAETSTRSGSAVTGATCLYAVYDPADRSCTMARAGHLPPLLVGPDGIAEFAEVPAGPPLGLGNVPFESATVAVPDDSRLVLYTDGLIEDRSRDIDAGLELLRTVASDTARSPEETCEAVLATLLPERPGDDVALLVTRTHGLPAGRVARWEVPGDPAAVADIRAGVTAKLTDWGLDELAFTTELILSELVTNAIRYGAGPIGVRMLYDDRSLICEVSDTSSTSPHLRSAASTDEGGRGLFLVAQFAERWGTRYLSDGKIIWAEQSLPEG